MFNRATGRTRDDVEQLILHPTDIAIEFLMSISDFKDMPLVPLFIVIELLSYLLFAIMYMQ